MRTLSKTTVALTALAAVASTAEAQAQQQGGPAPPPAPAPGTVVVPTQGGDVYVTPGQTTTSHVYVPPPGYPAPGTDQNAGLPSSSRPSNDTSRSNDSFDLNRSSGGAPVVTGDKGSGGIVMSRGGGTGRAARVPTIHTVRRGDTLWDLSSRYYGNPYNWPRVWSYNPQIENPHWIYPGDQIRMRRGGGLGGAEAGEPGGGGGGGPGEGNAFAGRRSGVRPDTVFLRSQGFIGDSKRDVWGDVVGAREDQMLLSEGNHIYLRVRPGVDVQPGQNLTVFRTVRTPERVPGARKPPGEIVAIKGTVRIDHWDPKSRIARGEITESVDTIERGSKVGPVGRHLDVVAARPNGVDLYARVLTSIYPQVYMSQEQVVFIDKGKEDGLEPGNRLLVVRRGDSWRRSLQTSTRMARERVDTDVPEHDKVEVTPLEGDEQKFPEEVIGELRILRTEKYSSIALVTSSHREIMAGDRAIARKGY